MGKAIKWLKALIGFKKEKKTKEESNYGDRKAKIPSCIGRSHRDVTNSPMGSPLLTPPYNNHSEEHKKRSFAIANATTVAAGAAVNAAEEAVAFLRLTTRSRVSDARENAAAIRIQTMYRGLLARKALKGMKSLVKFQALVRGHLVRKKFDATLQGMEALSRARSSVCAQRVRLQDDKFPSNFHSRRLTKRASEARSRRISASFRDVRPNPVEKGSLGPKSRLTRANTWARSPSPISSNPHSLSIPNHHELMSSFSSTQNTPRFSSSCGPYGYEDFSKDDWFTSHPGYMANTKSFRAKVRSHSAPKQRPECGFWVRKRIVLNEVECGPKSKTPSPLEVNKLKNFVMGRIGKSSYV